MSNPLPLADRLAAVSAEVQRVDHDGQMGGRESYRYTSINAIADAARPLLAKHGVAIVPGPVEVLGHDEVTSKSGAQGYHVVIRRAWTITGGGQELYAQSIGGSIDYSDKAYNKAHTFARKNLLVDLLNLSTGDDPDADRPDAAHRQPTYGRQRAAAAAQAAAAAPKPAPVERLKPQTPYEEVLAVGRADGMSKETIRKVLKEAGITRPADLNDDAVFKVAMDAVSGFIGGQPEDKGGLPVADLDKKMAAEFEADAAWAESKKPAGKGKK